MDKSTLSNYGWVVIVTLVLSVMLAFATPFGSYVAKATANVVKYYKEVTGDTFSADYIKGQGDKWDDYLNDSIPSKKIEEDPHIYGIGKTKSEYVLAIFNEDYTHVDIVKNGSDSDGIMMNWNYNATEEKLFSPMRQHRETLKTVTIKDGVKSIGSSAFLHCTKITSIGFNNDLETIEYAAFMNCAKLITAELPASVNKIEAMAFRQCSSLEKVVLNNNITKLQHHVFFNCEKLTSVNIPANLELVGQSAFHNTGLTSIDLPDTVTYIGESAFQNGKFTTFKIPSQCETLENFAFAYSYLKEVTIPNKVKKLGDSVFYSTAIAKAYISESVEIIGDNPFASCSSLKSLTISPNNPYFKIKNDVLYDVNETEILCYPIYKSDTTYNTPSTTKIVNGGAFEGVYKLDTLTLNEGLTTIEKRAFWYSFSSNSSSCYIPSTTTNIDESAFRSNTTLKNITVSPSNPKYASLDGALYNKDFTVLHVLCMNFYQKDFVMPNTVKKITQGAIHDSIRLNSITLPEGIEEINISSDVNGPTYFVKKDTLAETWVKQNNFTYQLY